jgi:hypothetical protein
LMRAYDAKSGKIALPLSTIIESAIVIEMSHRV